MELLRNVPVGQFVSGKAGWLRRLDPRLKFAWVLMFLITPVLAGPLWRVGVVIALLLITFLGSLPFRIIYKPLVFLIILSFVFGLLSLILPASAITSEFAARSPEELPEALVSSSSWELIRINPIGLGKISFGPLIVDRGSAELGLKTSTLIFTVVHSVNLMLVTTSPEDLVWTLRWYLTPFSLIGFSLDKMSFQLLLALRFIPLIQEEFQNLIRSILVRAVDYKKLGFKKSLGLFLSVGERLLTNILLRAEQGADSLLIRNNDFILKPDLFRPKRRKEKLLNSVFSVALVFSLFLRKKFGAF